MRDALYHRGGASVLALMWSIAGPACARAPAWTTTEVWVRDDEATTRALRDRGALWTEGSRYSADGVAQVRVLLPPEARAWAEAHAVRIEPGAPHAAVPSGYHSPAALDAALDALAANSGRAAVVALGASQEGRAIRAIWFGQPPGSGAPQLRVAGAHHGDEPISAEVALAFATLLSTEDGQRDDVTALLDRATVWVVPDVNPDGLQAGTRLNANLVDLNRNYDYGWRPAGNSAGSEPFSEPETRALRLQAAIYPPGLSLALHAGAANIGYPWNATTDPAPDEATLVAIATDYASVCTQPDFWVTNGAAWYRTTGDLNDWSLGRYGGLDLTVELSEQRAPPASAIPRVVDAHLEAMLLALTRPPLLAVRARDATTLRPVDARVVTQRGGLPLSSTRRASPVDGTLTLYATTRPDVLWVSAPGYETRRVLTQDALGDVLLAPKHLQPASLRVLAPGEALALPVAWTGALTLSAAGCPDELRGADDGIVPAPACVAGPVSATLADGRTWRNAWLITEAPETLTATRSDVGLSLVVSADGDAPTAWIFAGIERAWVPLPLTQTGPQRWWVDAADLPDDASPDVLLWVHGTLLGTTAVEGGQRLDTGSPSDTSPPLDNEGDCGCASQRAPWLALLPLLLAQRRRRP